MAARGLHRLPGDRVGRVRQAGEDPAGVEPAARPAARRRPRPSPRPPAAAARPPCGRGPTRRARARTPNPRSVKLSPLRTVRPMPSYGTQRTRDWSTPPCRIRSSISRPTALSANAVTTAVRIPKQRARPRATLYSPPPSQAVKVRVVAIRPSPGSRRSMTSPRATRSQRAPSAGSRIGRARPRRPQTFRSDSSVSSNRLCIIARDGSGPLKPTRYSSRIGANAS